MFGVKDGNILMLSFDNADNLVISAYREHDEAHENIESERSHESEQYTERSKERASINDENGGLEDEESVKILPFKRLKVAFSES